MSSAKDGQPPEQGQSTTSAMLTRASHWPPLPPMVEVVNNVFWDLCQCRRPEKDIFKSLTVFSSHYCCKLISVWGSLCFLYSTPFLLSDICIILTFHKLKELFSAGETSTFLYFVASYKKALNNKLTGDIYSEDILNNLFTLQVEISYGLFFNTV